MPARGEKKLVPIPVELLERLWALSERLGRPGRVLLEEIIDDGLRVYENGGDLREAVRKHVVFSELKRAGFIALPSRVLYTMITQLSESLLQEVNEEMKNLGRWYGKVVLAKYGEDPEVVQDLIEGMFWDATEVRVESRSEVTVITLISPTMSVRMGEIAESFISAFMESLGYVKGKSVVDVGFVNLQFIRGAENG